jgi:hypothetical protein
MFYFQKCTTIIIVKSKKNNYFERNLIILSKIKDTRIKMYEKYYNHIKTVVDDWDGWGRWRKRMEMVRGKDHCYWKKHCKFWGNYFIFWGRFQHDPIKKV